MNVRIKLNDGTTVEYSGEAVHAKVSQMGTVLHIEDKNLSSPWIASFSLFNVISWERYDK